MRRTTSELGVFFSALAILTTPVAAASDRSALIHPLIRCTDTQSPDEEPRVDSPPAGESAETAPQQTEPPESAPQTEPALLTDESGPFASVGQLLMKRCAMPGCHLGPDARSGLRLEVAQIYRSSVNVRARTDSRMLRVTPGAPDRSLLYLKLLPQEEGHYSGPRMPLSMNPLSPEEIAMVRAWIEAFPADRWGPAPVAELPGRPPRTFHDSVLANLPTPDPLGRNTIEFRIMHRFKESTQESGSYDFYGLDSGAWISLGLAYGLGETVEVGLRRTNLQHDYELYSKWVPVRQSEGGAPLSLALRGSFSDLRESLAFNRHRYGAQAIVARRFRDHLSLMLVPTYVTSTNYLDETDTRGTGAVGVGGEWRFNPKMAVTGEWVAQISGVQDEFQSGSIGYSIATARHAFHIFATNTSGSHTDLYVTGGDLKLRDGDFRLGFNISRTFTPR